MGDFGQLLVCVATLLSAGGGALALGGYRRKSLIAAAKKLFCAAAAVSAVSLLILVFLLLAHDYRVSYVRDYADRTMTLPYLVMAVWGGQEGSLLLWAVLQSFFTAAVALWGGGEKGERLLPAALGFMAALQLFFFNLVLFHSDPFEPLGTVAAWGIGLNPLLRNPYMAIHPPTLYVGFVGFSVPTAFAFAALVEGGSDDRWLVVLRPWILFAWVFLSLGNILGMVWAYEELGWGGYWGWDPVENASFMPWLTGTALLHSAMGMGRQGLFRLWSVGLVAVTFALIVFGTFLTRSGVIQSVHAFAGATAGPYLLALIVFILAIFTGLGIWRRRYLASSAPIGAIVSRESLLLATNWAFVLAALLVLLGTLSPLLSELLRGEKVAVTPQLFNRWMAPIGLVIFALVAACTGIGWRRPPLPDIGKSFLLPSACGAAAAVLAVFSGVRSAVPAVAIGLITLGAVVILRRIGGLLFRARKSEDPSAGLRRRIGGQLVHLAVVLLFAGFAGSAFTEEASRALAPSQTLRVGDYRLTFLGLREETDFERTAVMADLKVQHRGRSIGVLSPARHKYHSHPDQPTSEVVIRTGLLEDLFLILGETDEPRNLAVIKALVNPMVIWIWIGGALLALGTVVALWPRGLPGRLAARTVGERRVLLRVGSFSFFAAAVFAVVAWRIDIAAGVAALAGVGLVGALLLFGGALSAVFAGE